VTTTIAVLGAGRIGATLTRKWAAAGHTVTVGTHHPDRPEQRALAEETGAFLAAHADAVAASDIVLLAMPGPVTVAAVAALGSALDGKLVIDATNNIGAPVLNSLAAVAEHAPAAVAARAFNSLGWENFADPDFDGTPADLLWCGPDSDNGAIVEGLIADVGLRPVRVGDLDQIHVVDMLVALWSALALGQGRGRHLAFTVLAR
jgi:predicted dinucleotide-binding enzyme